MICRQAVPSSSPSGDRAEGGWWWGKSLERMVVGSNGLILNDRIRKTWHVFNVLSLLLFINRFILMERIVFLAQPF